MADDVITRGDATGAAGLDRHDSTQRGPRSRFRVVPGGGAGTGRPASNLVALEAPVARAEQQLAFPFVPARQAALISLGLEDLTAKRLIEILAVHSPRVAVDIRLSPSFSSWGLTRPLFNKLLGERGIEYRCWPELANRFVGDFPDYSLTLERYARYLETCDDVARLHELIRSHGPILLLGRLPGHQASERTVLTNALAALGADFDIVIA